LIELNWMSFVPNYAVCFTFLGSRPETAWRTRRCR